MTYFKLYDPDSINPVTQTARTYLVNLDVNSMYGNVISNIFIDDLFDIPFTKAHYQHFVRLYNRKKYHNAEDITAAGYTSVKTKWTWGDTIADETVWCEQNLKKGSFIVHSREYYFAYESDATLFKMRWL